jgi:hypothetical protein
MRRLFLVAFLLVCQVAHVVASLWMLLAIVAGSDRAWRTIRAYDRMFNAVTGGDDRELISTRANRGRTEGRRGWCLLCRVLDWLDDKHCEKSAGK